MSGYRTSEDRDQLLYQAVLLNRSRILCRIRSRHATFKCNFAADKKSQHPRLPLFLKALSNPKVSTGILPADFPALIADANILNQLSVQLESLSGQDINSELGVKVLVSIVVTCKNLLSREGLSIALERVPQFGSIPRESMMKLISKLCRYYTASTFLVQAAQRFPVLARIQISAVSTISPKVLTTELDHHASDAIDNVCSQQRARNSLPTTVRTKAASELKAEVLRLATAKTYPIHAEVQLLLHYEDYHCELPPRIISSSKKACYLCNLFFKLHGRFIIPSTHGRLYEKWALPDNLQRGADQHLGVTVQMFIAAVEVAIRTVINSANFRRVPAPYESVIFSSPVWSTTSLSTVTGIDAGQILASKPITEARYQPADLVSSEHATVLQLESGIPFHETAPPLCPELYKTGPGPRIGSLTAEARNNDSQCNSTDSQEGDSEDGSDLMLHIEETADCTTKLVSSKPTSNDQTINCNDALLHTSTSGAPGPTSHHPAENISALERKTISMPERVLQHSFGIANDSAIDLGSVSEAEIVSGSSKGYNIPPIVRSSLQSGVADPLTEVPLVYLPLKRGETFSKDLSPGTEVRISTPRLHIAVSYDQVTRNMGQEGSMWKAQAGNGKCRYRVHVKWLPPEEEFESRQTAEVSALDDFPRGSVKELSLHDSDWPKALWISRGNDILRIEYTLEAEEQGNYAGKVVA